MNVPPGIPPAGQRVGCALERFLVGRASAQPAPEEGVNDLRRVLCLLEGVFPVRFGDTPAIELVPELIGAVPLGRVMPNQALGVLLIVEESKALQPIGDTLGLLLTGLPRLQPIRQFFSANCASESSSPV